MDGATGEGGCHPPATGCSGIEVVDHVADIVAQLMEGRAHRSAIGAIQACFLQGEIASRRFGFDDPDRPCIIHECPTEHVRRLPALLCRLIGHRRTPAHRLRAWFREALPGSGRYGGGTACNFRAWCVRSICRRQDQAASERGGERKPIWSDLGRRPRRFRRVQSISPSCNQTVRLLINIDLSNRNSE